MQDVTRRREFVMLGLILLLGFVLRACYTATPRVVRWDEAGYQLIARNLLAGEGYHEVVGARDLQQPPFVAYTSVVGRLLGLPIPWATAGLAHVLLGGLLVLPVYGIGRAVYGRRAGVLAALLTALHPALAVGPLYWGTMTEPPYLLFLVTGVYCAWRLAERGQWRWACAMGGSFGLAYLVRPEAIAYVLILLVFVVLWRVGAAWRTGRPPWRTLALAAVAATVFVACCMPYVVYLYRVTGRWEFSGKQGISMDIAWAYAQHSQAEHDRVVAGLDATGSEIVWLSTQQYDTNLANWITANPARFITMLRTNISHTYRALFAQDLFQPWQVCLIVLGLFARPWTRARTQRQLLLVFAVAPTLALLLFFILSRFLVVVVPFGMVVAGEGLALVGDWFRKTANLLVQDGQPRAGRLIRGLSPVAPAAAALLLLVGGAATLHRETATEPFWRIRTAQWAAAHMPPNTPVAMRDSEIALYGGLAQVALPNADWSRMLAYVRARGARYLIIEDREIEQIRPDLRPLLNADNPHPLPGLTLVQRLSDVDRNTFILAVDPGKESS